MTKKTLEVYLAKEFVEETDWAKLIEVLSDYNGRYKKWELIVRRQNNLIRFFVEIDCDLPPTIDGLESFLFKEVEAVELPGAHFAGLEIIKSPIESLLGYINRLESKHEGDFCYARIRVFRGISRRVYTKVICGIEKKARTKEYIVCGVSAADMLAIDFGKNKRFAYMKGPNYLKIDKILHFLSSDKGKATFKVDTFPYVQGEFYLKQKDFSFDKHSVVVGASGCGKSKFLSMLIKNVLDDYQLTNQYKIIVIDPHAALENDIGGMGEVVDFLRDETSLDLFVNDSADLVISAELLLELFKSLMADQYNAKLERVLRHAILTLLANEMFDFANLRKLLVDVEYRTRLVNGSRGKVGDNVLNFFLTDFNELKTRAYGEAISPVINFVDEMEMLPSFNTKAKLTSLYEMLGGQCLTLVSLDRTKLGEKVTRTIVGLFLQQLLILMQKGKIREHVILMIDEVSIIENPILCRYLAEARKYNVSVVLAGQYFGQISEELRRAIFSNVVNYFVFRVSQADAALLVENINFKMAGDDSKEKRIRLMTELDKRECLARIESNDRLYPAFRARTLDFVGVPRKKVVQKNSVQSEPMDKPLRKTFTIGKVRMQDVLKLNSAGRENS